MLVLSWKDKEDIVIRNTETGETITIKIVKFNSGNSVRLGIEADKSYEIFRKEIAKSATK